MWHSLSDLRKPGVGGVGGGRGGGGGGINLWCKMSIAFTNATSLVATTQVVKSTKQYFEKLNVYTL